MTGVDRSLRDKIPSVQLREKMGTELVTEVVKRNRLRWLGQVLQKDDDNSVKRNVFYELGIVRGS